jgi:hypothetical protein
MCGATAWILEKTYSSSFTVSSQALGDYLVKEFGEWNPTQHKFGKIELCAFSNS